ncbi:hypothetical protein [Leucobacter sp. OH1287]|uniref:hypothetical protein n=1 Tax=Leucobacter sp. OH1287 TaxID=2491049 RepID=UPI000F5FDEE3|nr:hypothetical protein [Leucobacter sp. OH1287]RRD59519.1 hypothetical protein EII30_08525 [Leucobacter sp. OH1287]
MDNQQSKVTMDDWIRANDDAIQAKELKDQFIEAAKHHAELAGLDPEDISGSVFSLGVARRAATIRINDFINQILDSRDSLSCELMLAAAKKCPKGSLKYTDGYQLSRLLDEFSELVEQANPAQTATSSEEVTA